LSMLFELVVYTHLQFIYANKPPIVHSGKKIQ
jgi:hypothetical protein